MPEKTILTDRLVDRDVEDSGIDFRPRLADGRRQRRRRRRRRHQRRQQKLKNCQNRWTSHFWSLLFFILFEIPLSFFFAAVVVVVFAVAVVVVAVDDVERNFYINIFAAQKPILIIREAQ